MHRSGMQHALRLVVVLAFCVLVVGAANVPLWVCVALIVVLVALSWAAPGLRDERSFLPHSQQQHTDAS